MNLPKEQIRGKRTTSCRCSDHAGNSDASKRSRGFQPGGMFVHPCPSSDLMMPNQDVPQIRDGDMPRRSQTAAAAVEPTAKLLGMVMGCDGRPFFNL